jgi:hypothetical protein
MNDQSLSDPTPVQASPGASVFGNPDAVVSAAAPIEHQPITRMLTVEDVLSRARLPEKRARVCLRADLQAEYDDLVAELSTLVNARGELLEDNQERAMGETSAQDRALELGERVEAVRREMAESMWFPLFRGLSTDDLAVFNKQHIPKGEKPDLTEYNVRLVAECSVEPKMSVEQVQQIRKKLGSRAFLQLIQAANGVCIHGGVDVPKSQSFLVDLTQE